MKNIRCYGKNPNAPKKEKSFIRNFFEGNKSSDSSLFGKSSEDVLQADSLEENKENKRESFFKSPTLFGSIHLSPEKETLKKSGIKKVPNTNILPFRKKKVKRVVKRKPKKVFPKSTKHYASLQPRWSDFYRHDLTIEKQGNSKTCSILSSRYQNFNKIKRPTKCLTSVKNQGKRKFRKKRDRIFSSSSDSLSASDYSNIITDVGHKFSSGSIVTDVHEEKCSEIINRLKISGKSLNDCDPEQDLNSALPSANIIQELSKKFEENVKMGEFSVASDLHNVENLCPKSPLDCVKSPISFTKFNDSHGSRNLNTLDNLSHVLKLHNDNISVKTNSNSSKHSNSNSSKQLNPTSLIHSLEKTPVEKFMTSTPKIQKSIYIHYPVNDSYKSCGSGISTSKSSYSIFPHPMIITDKNLNFHVKKIDCSESYLKHAAPDKESVSRSSLLQGPKSLLSNRVSCNKSMTLPSKNASVSSVKNRSLLVSLRDSPPEEEESCESVKLKLLNLCNQDTFADFADVYDWKKCKIKKIGEGTYGEVYMIKKAQKGESSCVLKIIPVSENDKDDTCEGLTNVLSEVKITKCLSELRKSKRNNTKNFIKMNRVFVATGIYPPELIVAWDHFSETKTSYNARPDNYKEGKMFVLLELEYGGIDLSSCVLRNALEAECVLKQVATALAVAEEEFAFEHRDLHLGNILIKRTTKKHFTYKLRGKDISFECHGVQATLIDFTLSRLYEEGYIYYNDLAEDPSLFEQTGDHQFKVYKDMKNVIGNQWQEACFYSNVLWLKYLCQKFKEFEYSRPSTKLHKKGLKAIDKFNEQLTNCNSAVECLTVCGITPIYFERSDTDSELAKKSILISRNSIQKPKLSLCI